jgi:hypothetical protein
MGKPKFPALSAGTPAQAEFPASWMRDLQLQSIAVDTARWTPQHQPALWHAFKPRARARRLH